MPTYRYVFADVFTDTALTGNQLAVFTDARGLDAETMQALALEIGFSETVFVLPPEQGGTARIRIFNPAGRDEVRRPSDARRRLRARRPLQRGVVGARDGRGIVPVVLERDESGRIVFGRMTQPVPRVEEVEARTGPRRDRRAALDAPDRAVRQRRSAHRGEARRRRGAGALVRDGAAIEALGGTGVNAFARSERLAEPHALGARRGSRDRLRRRADRLPPGRHGLLEWGDEIVIAQGVEMGRPSTLHARADGGDGLIDAVEVGGAAVIVARGEFRF